MNLLEPEFNREGTKVRDNYREIKEIRFLMDLPVLQTGSKKLGVIQVTR